jgi:hypothetical protein
MEASYQTRSGRITLRVEAESPKQLFRSIAELQNIFEADTKCGCCESVNLRLSVRTVQDNEYFELACEDCSASLSLGQTRIGNTLFPKRKDADGTLLPNRGWKVWRSTVAAGSAPVKPATV